MRARLCKKLSRVEVIEMMLDCGYLRRDAEAAASAIRDFAAAGHLELMRRLRCYIPQFEKIAHRGYWSNRLIGSCFGALVDSCKGGKLETVQWLHQYPICLRAIELLKSGQCYADPITEAAGEGHWEIVQYLCDQEIAKDYDELLNGRFGHLHVLRFLLEHRSDNGRASRSCQTEGTTVSAESDDDVPRKCTVQFDEGYDGHYWGHTVIHKAIENGQLVQCLEEGILLDPFDREIAIKHALQLGDMDFAERLLPPGQSIDQYAADVARPEMIQMMLDSGNLQWDEQRAATALGHLGAYGDLELMQQIFQLHSPLREDHGYWKEAWSEALRGACSDGDLSVLQWLIEHPLRSEQWAERQTWCKQMLFENAAKNGHVRVMQYLHDQGLVIDTINRSSFGELQLDSVKWLIENDMIGDQHDFSYAIAQAALHGRLDILQLFQALDTPWSNEAVGFKRRRTGQAFSLWGGDRDTMEQRRREAAKGLLKHSLFGFQAHDAVVSERLSELKDLLLATCGERDQIGLLSENIREIEEQLKSRSERFLLDPLRRFEQDMELLLDVGSGDEAEDVDEDSEDDDETEECLSLSQDPAIIATTPLSSPLPLLNQLTLKRRKQRTKRCCVASAAPLIRWRTTPSSSVTCVAWQCIKLATDWPQCRKETGIATRADICCSKAGAMAPTIDGGWVHVACSMFLPELYVQEKPASSGCLKHQAKFLGTGGSDVVTDENNSVENAGDKAKSKRSRRNSWSDEGSESEKDDDNDLDSDSDHDGSQDSLSEDDHLGEDDDHKLQAQPTPTKMSPPRLLGAPPLRNSGKNSPAGPKCARRPWHLSACQQYPNVAVVAALERGVIQDGDEIFAFNDQVLRGTDLKGFKEEVVPAVSLPVRCWFRTKRKSKVFAAPAAQLARTCGKTPVQQTSVNVASTAVPKNQQPVTQFATTASPPSGPVSNTTVEGDVGIVSLGIDWPQRGEAHVAGMNKLGGVGRIKKVNEDTLPNGKKRFTYNVAYVLSGTDKNVERKYISVVDLEADEPDKNEETSSTSAGRRQKSEPVADTKDVEEAVADTLSVRRIKEDSDPVAPTQELLLHRYFPVKVDDALVNECFSAKLLNVEDRDGEEVDEDDTDKEDESDEIKTELATLQNQFRAVMESNELAVASLTKKVEEEYASKEYRQQELQESDADENEREPGSAATAESEEENSDNEDISFGGMFVNKLKQEGSEECALCELSGGDFTATDSGTVVHPQCAMFTPETFFKDGVVHGIDLVDPERRRLKCSICGGLQGANTVAQADISSSKTNRKRKRKGSNASITASAIASNAKNARVTRGSSPRSAIVLDGEEPRCARWLEIELSDDSDHEGKAVEAWQQGRDPQHVFIEGNVVEVLARDWRGINKPGGVARVRGVEVVQNNNGGKDIFYHVVHIVGAFKEKRLPAKYVRRYQASNE
ncbi:Ankyrin repeat-containing domain [Phytophthora cactorum]|nr:Ankyrin repeat-containing domain [Phytophthora cactorum]